MSWTNKRRTCNLWGDTIPISCVHATCTGFVSHRIKSKVLNCKNKKKVFLRDRMRRTARGVATTPYPIHWGRERGYILSCLGWCTRYLVWGARGGNSILSGGRGIRGPVYGIFQPLDRTSDSPLWTVKQTENITFSSYYVRGWVGKTIWYTINTSWLFEETLFYLLNITMFIK